VHEVLEWVVTEGFAELIAAQKMPGLDFADAQDFRHRYLRGLGQS
jgi:hypothetical protein